MNFHQLRVFLEVAKEKNFSAAAARLCVTQPAVTWQVKNLEEHYGLRFFERTRKKITLTAEGKILFDFADRILNLSRQAEEALTDLKGLSRGALRIDSVPTFGDYSLPALLDLFHKRYPGIAIEIHTGNSRQVIENTLLHKNDIAFVARDPENEKLVARELLSDLLVGIVSPRHPFGRRKSIFLKELNGQPLILREQGSSSRASVDEILKRKGVSPVIIMESASTSLIKKMVEGDTAMAILSQQVVKKEVLAKSLRVLPISDVEIARRFYIIYHKDKYFSRVLKAFMDVALEMAPKLSAD
jgi:DNA-binding transcriptional LysR family regulator